jgi:hypothetical protein
VAFSELEHKHRHTVGSSGSEHDDLDHSWSPASVLADQDHEDPWSALWQGGDGNKHSTCPPKTLNRSTESAYLYEHSPTR